MIRLTEICPERIWVITNMALLTELSVMAAIVKHSG
jgi:hypothetical protein